jgi:adenylate cyclase
MKSKLLVPMLVSALVGTGLWILWFLPLGERFEISVVDYWFSLRGKVESPNDIVVVAMDEVSYRDLNIPLNQAWPRKVHAQLINRLADLGARRVVFDILFLDAGSDPQADEEFAQALNRVPVFLGAESAVQQIGGASGSFALEEMLEPYAPFARNAAGVALVALPETDGVVRRFMTERSEVSAAYPTLAEAGAGFAVGDGKQRPSNRDLINFFGGTRAIQTLSYYQVLQTERPIPETLIKDKIVFVGLALRTATGPAQKDVFATSFGGAQVFGAEIHATAAANLIRGNWIRRLPAAVEQLAEVFLAIALTFLLINCSPARGGLVLAGCIIAWGAISYGSFVSGLFLPGALLFLIILPLAYLGSTLYYYFVAQRSARQMKAAFELYLSPDMAAQLSSGDSRTALGGSKTWATALFTDIAEFTNITEEMPAERVAEMLNAYFTEVMEVVFQNKGTLIKFIGDAVFVLWGAPIRIDNHAELAIRTGLALNSEVERFNKSGRFPALRTRIGLNTGPMVVGNLGSKRRFDYTAIGDSVNLASRVEGLNKYFGTSFLFTEATRKEAGNSIAAVPVAHVRVVGKKETISLFTTFEPAPSPTLISAMNELLEQFKGRRWSAVRELCLKIAALEPKLEGVARLYRTSADHLEAEPPPTGWAGEMDFAHK